LLRSTNIVMATVDVDTVVRLSSSSTSIIYDNDNNDSDNPSLKDALGSMIIFYKMTNNAV